jgi:hypothetical protein
MNVPTYPFYACLRFLQHRQPDLQVPLDLFIASPEIIMSFSAEDISFRALLPDTADTEKQGIENMNANDIPNVCSLNALLEFITNML